MWIIIVTNNLQEWRDSTLSEIFDGVKEKKQENYLFRNDGQRFSKYNYTSFLPNALTYKTQSGAERMVKDIKRSDKSSWKEKYYNLKDKHLSVRKLEISEWNKIVDFEMNRLESNYKYKKSQIEKKRLEYSG